MSVILKPIILILLVNLFGIPLYAVKKAPGNLNWISNWQQAIKVAKTQEKLIVLDLYTNWCGWCKIMDVKTYGDPSVIQDLGPKYVWLRLNAETDQDGRQAQKRFRILEYPATLLIDPEEQLFEKTSGFLTSEQLKKVLNKSKASLTTILQLRSKVRKNPGLTEAKRELATKYLERKYYSGAERIYRELITGNSILELEEIYFSLSITLAQQGKEKQAFDILKDLRIRFPESNLVSHAMALQGEIQLNLGNRTKAVSIWREYLRRFPEHIMTKRIMEHLKQIGS